MLNKVADGATVTILAPSEIKAGGFVNVFGKVGVAVNPISSGAKGVVDMTGGVYQINTSAALAAGSQGQAAYVASFPTTGADLTLTSSGGVQIGYLEEPVTSGARTAKVRLLD